LKRKPATAVAIDPKDQEQGALRQEKRRKTAIKPNALSLKTKVYAKNKKMEGMIAKKEDLAGAAIDLRVHLAQKATGPRFGMDKIQIEA